MINKKYNFGHSVFICSKPLQFFHLLAIAEYYSIDKPKVYIVTKNFSGWEDFQEKIIRSEFYNIFSEINFLPSYDVVCGLVIKDRHDSLFIEDDRVSLYFSFLKLKNKNMIVFEEGFGTYCSDFPEKLSWFKKIKWVPLSFIKGCGLNFGGGRHTDHVLVQYPLVYKKLNKLSSFKASGFSGVHDIFFGYDSFWGEIVNRDIATICTFQSDTKVCLLLATWGGAESEELQKLCEDYDVVIYKSHPHDEMLPTIDNVYNLRTTWIPAEVYIDRLASVFNNIHIYHYSSSTSFYLDGYKNNVKFIDLLGDFRYTKSLQTKRDLYNPIYI